MSRYAAGRGGRFPQTLVCDFILRLLGGELADWSRKARVLRRSQECERGTHECVRYDVGT